MAQAKKQEFENSAHLLDDEDAATIALLKKRMKSFDEGRVMSSEEFRQQINKWLTKSSTTKKH